MTNQFPFSNKLNLFITNWYEQHRDIFIFTDVDSFDQNDIETTFNRMVDTFEKTGKIFIWTGFSENTIFGSAEINHMFRAWHDYTHIVHGLGFSIVDESIVSQIQCDQLPSDWTYQKSLVNCEIVGQAHYFYMNGEFLNDQRKFTIQYLESSIDALRNKNF